MTWAEFSDVAVGDASEGEEGQEPITAARKITAVNTIFQISLIPFHHCAIRVVSCLRLPSRWGLPAAGTPLLCGVTICPAPSTRVSPREQ